MTHGAPFVARSGRVVDHGNLVNHRSVVEWANISLSLTIIYSFR